MKGLREGKHNMPHSVNSVRGTNPLITMGGTMNDVNSDSLIIGHRSIIYSDRLACNDIEEWINWGWGDGTCD